VYCEFAVRVDQILKAVVPINPSSIAVERSGGAVRFPSHRRNRISADYMPGGNCYFLSLSVTRALLSQFLIVSS
jgi:hypothetical protein